MKKYLNRREAGLILAEALLGYHDQTNVIILALPRGGVPVAFEVASMLNVPLDVFIVRKLGVPGYNELAMGAIAQGGIIFLNQEIVNAYQVTQQELNTVIAHEQAELQRRESAYRGNRPLPSAENNIVILIDDGIATGATMKAAIQAIRQQKPKQIIAAVPVADQQLQTSFRVLVDGFVCPMVVDNLHAVGAWYDNFSQVEDIEVIDLLNIMSAAK
jgi:putative phosphoribosyl transferase